MFGLALRSYQQKVQRSAENVTDGGRTLQEAVYARLGGSLWATVTKSIRGA